MRFMWEPPTYHKAKDAQICDVEGIGRLLVRRTAKFARSFEGLINGKRAIIEEASMDRAKAALEKVALRKQERT